MPFVNGAAVYYHHRSGDIQAVHDILPSHKQKIQLIPSVMYDLEDNIVIGGIRAMGIINSHLTLPLMRMLDEHEISVIDTNKYYTRLHDCVRMWMINPHDLLNDTAVMCEDFAPVKNDIHIALYEDVDEEVQFNTEQAIGIILHNLLVCITSETKESQHNSTCHARDFIVEYKENFKVS